MRWSQVAEGLVDDEEIVPIILASYSAWRCAVALAKRVRIVRDGG